MESSASINLRALPVSRVQGIGKQKALDLMALSIGSVADLIEYYPFRYEDYSIRDLSGVKDGEKITIQGTIYSEPSLHMIGRSKSRLTCKMVIDSFFITAVWFNRHFLKDQLQPGTEIVVTGKWDARRLQITVSESEFPGRGPARSGTLQPVYSVAGPISQQWMRKAIRQAMAQYGELIDDPLPPELLERHGLWPRKRAIALLHEPGGTEEGSEARRRMAYEELFLFQLKLQAFRALTRSRADGIAHEIESSAIRPFTRSLPFTLTDSQKRVVLEILHDLRQPYAMNRLLQGDVGSGKTAVAAIALFAVVKAGGQGVLMVPTEILAEQHLRSLERMFEPFGVTVGILTGSLTERNRRDTLAAMQMGMLDVVVGTHALIQEDVFFRRLGLVVTDEQHRFGVHQRSILRRKGMNPDVLTMTATPIPRTLAITAFGDLDVSSLRELPKGRKPIQTNWVKHHMLDRVLRFIGKEAAQGRQAYFICPLIEESEKLDVQNAIDLHIQLQQFYGGSLQVGLLHGRMSAAEKEETMRRFSLNELQVLVSTTVIEVGVDVPNATIMVIHDADRFGLSQLHQLRGRVGRGEHQSYCVLIADPKSETGRMRMQVMAETNDGFEIARRDLELRGPGDFFGTKQSGMPEFKIADVAADFELLELARDDAAELVGRESFWTGADMLGLRRYLQREQVLQGEVLD